MVMSQPNETEFEARVTALRPADDGWGAWAELTGVRIVTPHDRPELEGGAVEARSVFVPPPLVDAVRAALEGGTPFRGVWTENGPQPVYTLVPPPVRPGGR